MNNEFENNRNDMELEAMRQQMNTLKKKLEQQEIVNDRIIRHSMKQTAGNISRRYYIIMALCLLMIPYSYWAFVIAEQLLRSFLDFHLHHHAGLLQGAPSITAGN